MKYSELTLHYFQTAPATGVLTGPDVYRGAAGNRAQGTWVQFDLRVSGGIIHAARFLAFACPHTIAATAWVAEHAGGPLSPAPPGSLGGDAGDDVVHCGEGDLELISVQPAGKRPMAAGDWRRGVRPQAGEILGGDGP